MEKLDSIPTDTPSRSIVSLFSGAGGMSLGFADAGLKPVLAADIDADACATYSANIGPEIVNVDLSDPSASFLSRLNEHKDAFAIIGGPPCQGFSSAGMKNGTDKRNSLIFHYLGMVERVRPRWFLFENVEGLLTSNGGQSVVDLVEEFIRLGYRVRLEKVNFASYGLPQARKRVLLVGNLLGLDFSLPIPTHSFNAGKHRSSDCLPASPTVDDAIAGLGNATPNNQALAAYASTAPINPYDELMRCENRSSSTNLHGIPRIPTHLRAVLAQLKQGQTMKDLPEAFWHESYRRRAFRRVMDGTPSERRGGAPSGVKRLSGSLNALTITGAASREFVHPSEDRPLTLREAARLQSFPDRFRFHGNSLSVSRQIGNAFPPLAAQILARHLLKLDSADRANKHLQRLENQGALVGFHLTAAEGMSPALAKTHNMLKQISRPQSALPFDMLHPARAI